MNKYIFDSHVHSNNSFDGSNSVLELCEQAIINKIDGFCITDHLEVQEYNKKYEESIRKSHKEAREANEMFNGKLQVNTGIEMAQPLQDIETTEKILKEFPCDFIIGSMHNVKNEKDFYFMKEEDFKYRIDELLTKYYEEYYEMVKWGKFDVIGHITYPLRYIQGNFKINVDMSKYDEVIYEMLKLAVKKDIGIEVNVSGFRQNYKKQFPNLNHIKHYIDLGGKIITLGSDAHNKYDIGKNFNDGKNILLQCGTDYYCKFNNRNVEMIKIK